MELPACIEHDVPVVLDDKTLKAYRQFERDLLLTIDEDTVEGGEAHMEYGAVRKRYKSQTSRS